MYSKQVFVTSYLSHSEVGKFVKLDNFNQFFIAMILTFIASFS